MDWFKNLSIRSKLFALSVISAGIALSISCIGFIATDLHVLYEAKKSQLMAQAEMLGFNAGMILSTRDSQAAEQLLAPLESQTSLSAVALYADNGDLIAQYAAEGQASFPSTAPNRRGFSQSHDGAVEILHVVVENGQTVGSLLLRADMRDYWARRFNFLLVAVIVLGVSFFFTAVLSHWLQRPIARPIVELASATQRITDHADLSVRVDYRSRDEIGSLFTAFNRMLDRVQETELELLRHHDHLEYRVCR